MKFTLMALVATASGSVIKNKFIENVQQYSVGEEGNVISFAQGIDKKDLQPDRHWTKPWPQGIDNGEDDEKILNWAPEKAPEKKKEAPLRYMNVRPAIPGQWPPGKIEHEDGTVTHYGKVDDGTDDDTVINVHLKAIDGMENEHFKF